MSDESLKWILDRDLSKVEAKEKIEKSSAILREVIDYATRAFGRCNPQHPKRHDLAILLVFLHVVEMADAVEILISNASVIPAKLQLRSIFEGLLSLEYLLNEDTERRAKAFLYFYIKDRYKYYCVLDESTKEGSEIRNIFKKDKHLSSFRFPEFPDIRERISEAIELLGTEDFKDIKEELEKINKKYPKWYELFNGPVKLSILADRLKRSGQYYWFYDVWSKTIHSKDLPLRYVTSIDENIVLNHIRNTEELKEVLSMSSAFLSESIGLILRFFRSDELPEFKKWQSSIIDRIKKLRA